MTIDTDLSKPILALMMHDVYRYIVQTKVGSEVARDPRGPDVIRLNYKPYTSFGPTKGDARLVPGGW